MKLNSVSGLSFYVKDLEKTATFYEALGFGFRTRSDEKVTINLNWFWIDFLPIDKEDEPKFKEEANLGNKGAGVFTYLSVADVDEFYNGLIEKGLKPSTEPKDWPSGNREFVIRDPDGYKLVVFKRK